LGCQNKDGSCQKIASILAFFPLLLSLKKGKI